MSKTNEQIVIRLKEVNAEIEILTTRHFWDKSFTTIAEAEIYEQNNLLEINRCKLLIEESRNLELSLMSESDRINYLKRLSELKDKGNSFEVT